MELYWKHLPTHDYNDGSGLDLDDVWDEPQVIDAETFKLAVLHHIALWAIKLDYSMDKIVGFTLDNDSDEVEIDETPGDWTWLSEVSELMAHLKGGSAYAPVNAYMAKIKDAGWKWFNFDDYSDVEDYYHSEFDGDYEDFAKEWMDGCGESIAEHLEYHFDYASYGESLVEDYDRIEFAGDEFLFSR